MIFYSTNLNAVDENCTILIKIEINFNILIYYFIILIYRKLNSKKNLIAKGNLSPANDRKAYWLSHHRFLKFDSKKWPFVALKSI